MAHLTQVRSTYHSCSSRNVHRAVRTTDSMEAYDGMVSNKPIKYLRRCREVWSGLQREAGKARFLQPDSIRNMLCLVKTMTLTTVQMFPSAE
ncbi:hypothetical protein GW17_00047569 [Ensete ventricosum]|nr:hypothetical protein GW17_00047569 [Ensete ventricosum]